MQTMIRRTALCLLLFCAACGTRGDGTADDTDTPPDESGTVPPAQPAPDQPAPHDPPSAPHDPPSRPATRADTVLIEGMPEVEEQRLVTSPEGFVVPFSTYVPEGLDVMFAPPTAVRFIAAFAGNRNDEAFMVVHVQDEATNVTAEQLLSELATQRRLSRQEIVQRERPSWAIDAAGLTAVDGKGTRVSGSAEIVEHAGRRVHIIRHYPAEYGDGLGPRLHTILSEWRWEDTGTMLRQ